MEWNGGGKSLCLGGGGINSWLCILKYMPGASFGMSRPSFPILLACDPWQTIGMSRHFAQMPKVQGGQGVLQQCGGDVGWWCWVLVASEQPQDTSLKCRYQANHTPAASEKDNNQENINQGAFCCTAAAVVDSGFWIG